MTGCHRLCLAWLGAAALAVGLPAVAQERLLAYHADIEVQADGQIEVAETIRVRAEGRQIRRGIYRDFPTRYRDRYGNRVVVGFEVLEVLRDGRREPWFTERVSNGIRINTGDDSFLPVPADIEFTIRYRTSRQLGYFDDFDELYWNVTGTGWVFAIERASARVRLPEPVAAEDLALDFYTGPQGATGKAATARVTAPGEVRFNTTSRLAPGENLTIVVGFPKGIVAEPGAAQQAAWFLYDNRGVLVAIAGLVLVLSFYLRQWNRKGRDPQAGPIFARYEPPAGYSPGGLRYLVKRLYDSRCFAADLVHMAVLGFLSIRREGGRFAETWTVARKSDFDQQRLTPGQQALFRHLFSGGDEVELKQANASLLSKSRGEQQQAFKKRFRPRYFIVNAGTLAIGLALSVVTGFVALIVAAGDGLPALAAVLVILALVNVVFVFLMPRPTEKGRRLLDEVEGLKLYLSVADKDDIGRLEHRNPDEPPLDAERFEMLLPYALALDVEDAWTEKFTRAAGATEAAAATRRMSWYHGGRAGTELGDLGAALGKSLSSRIASASSPPGSSSGGGGGGSSGGGGGGGGGGGR